MMSVRHEWSVFDIRTHEVNGQPGIVHRVSYKVRTYDGTDETFYTGCINIPLDENSDIIPVDQLTESQVLEWIKNQLNNSPTETFRDEDAPVGEKIKVISKYPTVAEIEEQCLIRFNMEKNKSSITLNKGA